MRFTDQEFIELWKKHESPTAMAEIIGMSLRNVQRRRRHLEVKYGESLTVKKFLINCSTKPSSARKDLGMLNGTVIVFSDAHWWPGIHTTAFKGLLWAIKK